MNEINRDEAELRTMIHDQLPNVIGELINLASSAKDDQVRRAALDELQKRRNQIATYTGEHADKVDVVTFGKDMAPASGVVIVKREDPEESQD